MVRFTEVPTQLGKIADYSSRLSNALGSIAGFFGGGNVLRYPMDMIDSSTDYMKISCLEYTPSGGFVAEGSLKVAEGSEVNASVSKIKSTIYITNAKWHCRLSGCWLG